MFICGCMYISAHTHTHICMRICTRKQKIKYFSFLIMINYLRIFFVLHILLIKYISNVLFSQNKTLEILIYFFSIANKK